MATPAKKARKAKDLPEGLSSLTELNFRKKINARLETDSKETGEVMVAFEVVLNEDEEGAIDLTSLTLDQLRKFCKNVGVQYVNNCSKFQCRKALWVLAQYQEQRERTGATIAVSDKTTNNIIRLTNMIFSHEFLDSFLSLNDAKGRANHETGDMPKNFWQDVSEAMNGSDDDDNTALQCVIEDDDVHSAEIKLVDLTDFDIMTSAAIKKKINHLLKVRKEIQKNMTLGGEHDSNPYNFVEIAMKNVGKNGLSALGCYYFFKRCDNNPKVDVHFSQEMDDALKGNTDDIEPLGVKETVSTSEKKRAYAAIVDISTHAKTIAQEMRETNRLAREAADLLKQSHLISVAQHLGKDELLEKILESVSSSFDD